LPPRAGKFSKFKRAARNNMGASFDAEYEPKSRSGDKGRSGHRDGAWHAAWTRSARRDEEGWPVASVGCVDAGNKAAGNAGSREEAKEVIGGRIRRIC
jgi:hypothetical protein